MLEYRPTCVWALLFLKTEYFPNNSGCSNSWIKQPLYIHSVYIHYHSLISSSLKYCDKQYINISQSPVSLDYIFTLNIT